MKTLIILFALTLTASASELFYTKTVVTSNAVTKTEYRSDGSVITNRVFPKRQPAR